MATYRITTWDVECGEFTPQVGVPHLVEGLGGLRRAIRALRALGYSAHRHDVYDNDPSVLIERLSVSSVPSVVNP